MKKKLFVLLLVLSCLLVLAGCACEHEWVEANCTTPKTCSKCEEIEGAPLGHTWHAATCAAPKTCEACGETEGEALSHEWNDADCVTPKTCPDCGATEGDALGHTWVDATYEAPKTCSVCAVTEGEPLRRQDLGYGWEEFGSVLNIPLGNLSLEMEYAGVDEDNWPIYYLYDTSSGEEVNAVIGFEPGADGKVLQGIMITAIATDQTATYQMGVVAGAALALLDPDFDFDELQNMLNGNPTIQEGVAVYSMENKGLLAEVYINTEYAIFWIAPVA